MIEGLKIGVTGSELRERLLRRVEWHRKRAEANEQKRAAIVGAGVEARGRLEAEDMDDVEIDELLSNTQVYARGTAREYVGKIMHSRRRADALQFFAEHVEVTEKYLLTERELTEFEIL